MDSNGRVILPIYLVFDPSTQGTMSLVEFANKLIELVFRNVQDDPFLCERLSVRLIEMQGSAVSLLPSNYFHDLVQIPGIVQSPAVSLRSVFENLKEWITEDITNLKLQGHQVYRPFVFMFLGRSVYNDDWQVPHRELTNRTLFKFAPNIFCFGTAEVRSNDIREIASVGSDELKSMAAHVMDSSVGMDVLAKSVWQEYIMRAIRSPFQAITAESPAVSFPTLAPGISPVVVESNSHNISSNLPPPSPGELPFKSFYNRVADMEMAPGSFPEDNRPWALPIYIVYDQGERLDDALVTKVNDEISVFIRGVLDLYFRRSLMVSLVALGATSTVVFPLTKLDDIVEVPEFSTFSTSSMSTNYSSLFGLLKIQLEMDTLKIHDNGSKICRPIVFLITKGQNPNEGWRNDFQELTGTRFRFRPNIVVFAPKGFDVGVTRELMVPIMSVGASGKSGLGFREEDGVSISSALFETLRFTI